MIISVTNTMVKIERRNNISNRNSLSVVVEIVFATEMIISSTKKMGEVTKEMVDLTKTGVLMMGMIFSAAKKIMLATEASFAVAKTMAFMTQIIIAEANKMLSVDKKILFVPPTVLRARQPVHCGSRCCNLIKSGQFFACYVRRSSDVCGLILGQAPDMESFIY
jgi:hypothetical protein